MFATFKSLCVIFLVFTFAAASVSAQDSRADEIAREQAEKSKQLRPNVPSGAERTLDWVEGYLTDPNTVYLTFGGIYPSAGFAPGVAVRRAMGYSRLNVGGAYSFRNYKLAHASLDFPELANHKLDIETDVRWADATQVPFYGVGNDTDKDDRVNYGLRMTEARALATVKPVRWFNVGGGIGVRQVEDREGAGSRPSIEFFPGALPAGGIFHKTTFTEGKAFAAIDWRETPGYSRRGGLYSVTLNDFRDSDDQFGFRRLDVELVQLFPILKEHWVIGFRGYMETTDADSGQQVPYYLLPSLGGSSKHRGYSDFRFQDRHMMVLTGEYRWLPSRVLDMALFFDAGKVASDRRDLDLEDLKTAWGIGLRIHGPNFTPFRLDVAHAKEGIRVHLTGNVYF
jgi:hypothetical protein